MKVIFSGLEGSGKSLKLAKIVIDIAYRNAKWLKESGIARPIASNLFFSDEFYTYVTKELGIPIKYWSNLDELVTLVDCDVIMDEVGNYFDARSWSDLSLDVRRWLTQGSKQGVELYGSAQDFAQVDVSFRRLVNNLVHITKIAGSRRPSNTKPPVKRIWGVCMTRELDPQGYDENKKTPITAGALSMKFFTIRKSDCEIFDTKQKIKKSLPLAMKHIERECEDPNCTYHKVVHI